MAGILLVLIIFFLSSHDFIPGGGGREKEKGRERDKEGRGGGRRELAPGERSPVKAFALKLCNLGRKFAFELLGKPRAAV